jgi:hypothetical protein
MAKDPGAPGANSKPPRRARGFRPAGALIGEQTRTAAARRGYAAARLKAPWRDIVGPEIAAVTRPARLAAARGPAGGLLTLAVLGSNGPQVQMLLPLIRERANAALGPGAVGRIQITQGAGFAEPPEAFASPGPPQPPPPLPPEATALRAPLSSIGDADLRAALETLARNVLSRTPTSVTKDR